MRISIVAIASLCVGVAISGAYLSVRNADEAKMAAHAYDATVATYVLMIVDSLRQLRNRDVATAIEILEPRLERDLEFLGETSSDSETITRAIAAAEAYRAEFLTPN